MKKLISIFSVVLLVCSFSAQAEVLAKDSMSDNQGSTRSKGSYSLVKDGNNVKLSINFNVRKSGTSGSGRGAMSFQILDDSWDPVTSFNKSLTVGADSLKGTADKDWKKNITLTGPKAKKVIDNGIAVAFIVDSNKDTIGVPTSIDDWKKALGDIADLKSELDKLSAGDSKNMNGWKVFKMK
jgi:hypothetical protein